MKLISYRYQGAEEFGIVQGDGVVSLSSHFAGRFADLRSILDSGTLAMVAAETRGKPADRAIADIEFLPVIPNPRKIFGIGINYRDHAQETGREVLTRPAIFTRFKDTLLGHQGTMLRPIVSTHFDFEGELAVVIGRGGRHIPEIRALDHVAGYSCFIDGSVRDFQKSSTPAGKNFPATGPFGPWLVTTDELPHPGKLLLITRLNGVEMQRSGTDMMIYPVQVLISYLSDITTLSPGDVIATGTPAGVGHRREPQLWMKAGDTLEVEISGIGILRSHIADERP